jgi:hypothetical protein
MTKQQLRRITTSVIVIYAFAIAVGAILRTYDRSTDGVAYSTFKDLLPLIIAIPAAYLAYSFQRRSSYLQALRFLWSAMIAAVQGAIDYTCVPNPSRELYLQTLLNLRVVIEEARGVFCNIPVKGKKKGWYPFEPIKEIHNEVRDLGFGDDVSAQRQEIVREHIKARWICVREQLLREYDRAVPTYHYAWYTSLSVPTGLLAGVNAKKTNL